MKIKPSRQKWLMAALLAWLALAPLAHAFYNPSSGRWFSRDPIDELGFNLLIHGENPFNFDKEKNLYAFCQNDPISLFDGDGRFPPVILIFTFGRGISHGILACYDCRQCLKCKGRAQELLDKYVAALNKADAEQSAKLAEWLKAAQPGAECAPLCGDCLKEGVLFAKWMIGGVVVKYGIRFVDGWRSPIE